MTVTRNIEKLDTAKVFPRVAIEEGALVKMLQFLNALYEGLIDSACPDGGSQLYRGHDHGEEGGVPIINGSQLCMDGGAAPIFEKTAWVDTEAPAYWLVAKHYNSPGLRSTGEPRMLEVAICYETVGSEFEIITDTGTYTTQITGDGVTDWMVIQVPIRASADWTDLPLKFRPAKYTDDTLELRIYAVHAVETYAASQPKLGARDVQTARTSNTVLRYFGEALADELMVAQESLHADVFKRIYSAANALLEGTIDQRAPGAGTQSIYGHDHSSTQLGRAIGHGRVYSAIADFDTVGGSPDELWQADATTLNQWEYADLSMGNFRRTTAASTPGGTVTADPMFWAAISSGISSSGNPPSSAPYIEGWVYVDHDDTAAAVVELRIYNLGTATHSETITFSAAAHFQTWTYIRYIPCSGGSWNEYAVEVRNTASTSGANINVRGIILAEAYTYNGNKGAYVASSGTRLLGPARSGSEAVTP